MSTQLAVSARDSARTVAHQQGLALPLEAIINDLAAVLGRELLAFIADKEERTVRRWIADESTPNPTTAARLRDVFQVLTLLRSEEGDHTIRAWFMGMNPQLDDVAPAEALAEGRVRDVMLAARAFVNGV